MIVPTTNQTATRSMMATVKLLATLTTMTMSLAKRTKTMKLNSRRA